MPHHEDALQDGESGRVHRWKDKAEPVPETAWCGLEHDTRMCPTWDELDAGGRAGSVLCRSAGE